jgi:hypothetical protein
MAGNDALILDMLRELREDINQMSTAMASCEKRLDEHSAESKARHLVVIGAFPSGDTDGHRRYHETVIEWRELRNKIVRECLINAAKAGFLGATGWVLYAIWVAFKLELSRS